MSRQMVRGLTMLALVVALAVMSSVVANGQADRVYAQIPFDFIVGDKTMASGEYSVRALDNAGVALLIKSTDANDKAIRLSNATGPQKIGEARLVFHRYGNTYFLAEVWKPGESSGRELRSSRQERAIKKEFEAVASKSEPNKHGYDEVVILATVR